MLRNAMLTTATLHPLQFFFIKSTVDSKIIRALEIVRVKKLILNAVLGKKYLSNHNL